ncbi:MAG: phospholipase [bacterium]|nr:phospholipase [bacterium]
MWKSFWPRRLLAAGFLGVCAVAGFAAAAAAPIRREVVVDSERLPVVVRVPPDYDPAYAWPLVVFLHGSGECGDDGRQTQVGLGPALEARPEHWPCLVLMPQKPTRDREWEDFEDLVLAAIADTRARWNIDGDRIALTGMSQGGHGTWVIGARHRDLFSCLAPVCGYGPVAEVAPGAANLPVWAFHGLRDDVVAARHTVDIVQEVRRLRLAEGRDPEGAHLTLYPTAGHNSWDAAYAEPGLAGWMLGQSRPGDRP